MKPAEEAQVIVTTESTFGGKHTSEAWYCPPFDLASPITGQPGTHGTFYENGHDISDSVIAWMPMPKPADLDGYEESK
jgi:hypothetical protein